MASIHFESSKPAADISLAVAPVSAALAIFQEYSPPWPSLESRVCPQEMTLAPNAMTAIITLFIIFNTFLYCSFLVRWRSPPGYHVD